MKTFTFATAAALLFTSCAASALLDTTPQENAIAGNFRRQDNGTVTSVVSAASTATLPVSSPESIVTSIETITPSGSARPSGNLTTPSTTMKPSASQTSEVPSESTGAASAAGMGMGVVVGAIAAMLV